MYSLILFLTSSISCLHLSKEGVLWNSMSYDEIRDLILSRCGAPLHSAVCVDAVLRPSAPPKLEYVVLILVAFFV